MFKYPTIQNVIDIHGKLIELSGDSHGVCDEGAISSALAHPQNGYYAGLVEEGTALFESLAGNHPFIDDNKRIFVAITDLFLRMNGYKISVDSKEAHTFLISLFEADNFKFEPLKEWLVSVVVELE